MSRPLRIEFPGAWYHIMNRGRRAEDVFTDANDYRFFLELLKESSELWNVRISAFCLMPNHYHLLMQTPEGNVSRCMRHINGVYTQRFNRAHHCAGQLFRGRFKSILVEGGSYLLQLVRYIHRNPLREGLVDRIDKYPWSSHKGYVSASGKWDWLYKDRILAMLSSERINPRTAYRRFVATEDDENTLRVLTRRRLPSHIGGKRFADWLKETFGGQKAHPLRPESSTPAPGVQEIREMVCRYYGVDNSALNRSRRGVFNEARHAAIFLTRRLRMEGLAAICREFSMRRYSSASSAIDRVKRRLATDGKFKNRIDTIRRRIEKRQTGA